MHDKEEKLDIDEQSYKQEVLIEVQNAAGNYMCMMVVCM